MYGITIFLIILEFRMFYLINITYYYICTMIPAKNKLIIH